MLHAPGYVYRRYGYVQRSDAISLKAKCVSNQAGNIYFHQLAYTTSMCDELPIIREPLHQDMKL